jgi:hypothetical protein
MTPIKAHNALLVPQIFYFAKMTKPQVELGKTSKHCTNYGRDNHNVETCRIKKKEEPIVVVIEATNQLRRVKRITCILATSVV